MMPEQSYVQDAPILSSQIPNTAANHLVQRSKGRVSGFGNREMPELVDASEVQINEMPEGRTSHSNSEPNTLLRALEYVMDKHH